MQSDQRALLTTDQGRMPYEYIRSMIKKIGVKIGMPEIHAHSFRHFYGTYMYRTTNDLRLVQILLGHARIETTTIYEHLSSKEAAEKGIPAVEKLFRGEDKMNSWVRIPAGAVQNKWDHWNQGTQVVYIPNSDMTCHFQHLWGRSTDAEVRFCQHIFRGVRTRDILCYN